MTAATHPVLSQIRVLRALMLREMITRYGRSSLGYLWALAEPVAVIALLSVIFVQIAHTPPIGRSFPLFYASGYLAFHWFNDIASVVGRGVQVNRPLLAFPVITPLDTALARFLLQALTGLAVAAAVLAGVLAWQAEPVRLDPAALAIAFALAALLGLGTGLMNAWAFARSKTWELIWGVISRPLFLISCVFFSFQGLPAAAREVLWWNPLIHVVGWLRAGIYPVYDAAHVSLAYPLALGLGLVTLGLVAFRAPSSRLAEA